MYESFIQPILRCERCSKPFDKESTLKRHRYYCRSQRIGKSTRPRACASCAKTKARCDNKLPCSRCVDKGTKCHYPTTLTKTKDSVKPPINDTLVQEFDSGSALGIGGYNIENSQEIVVDIDDLQLVTTPSMFNSESSALGEKSWDTDFSFVDSPSSQFLDKALENSLLESLSQTTHPDLFDLPNQIQQAHYAAHLPILLQPSYTLRSFTKRNALQSGAQRTASLIFHILKSYPVMLLRDKTLPPFIHPHLVYSSESEKMEPLLNCINLMYMLSNGVRGNRKLFWRNVQTECERFCAEHLSFGKLELLATMQALSIYILARLEEGETEHNNVDSLLVKTVIMVAIRFNNMDPITAHNTQLTAMSWKDWILKESARRLCIVYQIVNMLVQFEPAAMCKMHGTGLLLAPLPAKKQLWQANNEVIWKTQVDSHPKALSVSFGLAVNGDLIRVDETPIDCGSALVSTSDPTSGSSGSREVVDWEDWCSGMDEFGGLIMLAASLAT